MAGFRGYGPYGIVKIQGPSKRSRNAVRIGRVAGAHALDRVLSDAIHKEQSGVDNPAQDSILPHVLRRECAGRKSRPIWH
jgi:hypothetical protein